MSCARHPAWVRFVRLVLPLGALLAGGLEAPAVKHTPPLEADDHPEAVLVTARNQRTRNVGRSCGVLIAPRAVLTAAHGVAGFDAWEVIAPYAKQGPAKATAQEVRVHPRFRAEAIDNDLAVLVLSSAIDTGGGYPVVHNGDLYPLETRLVVVGRVANGKVSESRLYKAAVTVAPFPGNINLYGGVPQVVEGGDSGGPIYPLDKKQEVAALVSGNLGFSRSNVRIDVFIPISAKNRGWILRQIPAAEK